MAIQSLRDIQESGNLEQRCRFFAEVIVRPAKRWRGYVETNPFPGEAGRAAGFVVMALSKLYRVRAP